MHSVEITEYIFSVPQILREIKVGESRVLTLVDFCTF